MDYVSDLLEARDDIKRHASRLLERQHTTLGNLIGEAALANGHDQVVAISLGILSKVQHRNDVIEGSARQVCPNIQFPVRGCRGTQVQPFDRDVAVWARAPE